MTTVTGCVHIKSSTMAAIFDFKMAITCGFSIFPFGNNWIAWQQTHGVINYSEIKAIAAIIAVIFDFFVFHQFDLSRFLLC